MAITNGYATLAQVKSALRITDSVDDDLLELSINAASRDIDGYCQRFFYTQSAQTRIYAPQDSYFAFIDDLVSITTLKTSSTADGSFDTTWTSTDYQLEPLNGLSGGLYTPYNSIRAVGDFLFPVMGEEATIQVVGTFGWSSVPVAVTQACILLSMRQYKRYDSPLGVAGYGDLGVMRVTRFDPDVMSLLDPFVRVRAA